MKSAPVSPLSYHGRKFLRAALILPVALALAGSAFAAEGVLRSGDIVSYVGGEEAVATAEDGSLELFVTRAAPELHIVFRSLAWEGDTVFEQKRDLNYPSLDDQLAKYGSTVVIAQFGKMESLAGAEKLPEFVKAYGALVDHLSGGTDKARRVVLVLPARFAPVDAGPEAQPAKANATLDLYRDAIRKLGQERNVTVLDGDFTATGGDGKPESRDGLHASPAGLSAEARTLAAALVPPGAATKATPASPETDKVLREMIALKNRYWFYYYRPQNWAFLAGDRTNQPSSRDHLDPSKRWFPVEMEQYIPLIEAKEREIQDTAAKAAR